MAAAVEAQKVWFPPVVERLRCQWREGMSFEALVALRDDLDRMLQRVRFEENIVSPIVKCRVCRQKGPGPEPHVSVRAMILSLLRFDVAPAPLVYTLEKEWAAHRKQNDLDLYGKAGSAQPSCCLHSQSL